MISKHLPAHSFYHTCRYICQKKGADILIAEGVRGHDFKLMAADFLNQQQMRPGKQKACFHSILSFHPDEKPSDEMLTEIAQKYLAALGVVNTQVAVCKHTDRAHLHLHIVANMVDNYGNVISDNWIGLRGKKAAQQLTKEYGLIPAVKKDLGRTNLEALSQSEAIKYRIYQAIAENMPHCRTMEDLEIRLKKLGIETKYKFKGQTQEKQGISFKMGSVSFKGSEVDRKFSLIGLQKAIALLHLQQFAKNREKPERQPKTVLSPGQRKIISSAAGSGYHSEPEHSLHLSETAKNLIYEIFKPVPNGGAGGGDFSQDAYNRRKKKKKRPHP